MNFEDAFARLNGRSPTVDEVKEALAIDDIVKKSNLDPVLLMFIANAKAKEEREAFANNVRRAAADAITTIRDGLPTSEEWRKASAWAGWFSEAMHAASQITTRWIAIIGAIVALIAIFVGAITWLLGYDAGINVASGRSMCNALQNISSVAQRQHRADVLQFVQRERVRECR